ncbi:MAG: hypothetical protein JXO44_00290 [Clostridia bacterium]|nr:hypothetical protein [Clostridia bacterium]
MFNINHSRVIRYLALLIVGMSFITYGLLTLSQPKTPLPMSEDEIIQKAKDLGLVDPKDIYLEQQGE